VVDIVVVDVEFMALISCPSKPGLLPAKTFESIEDVSVEGKFIPPKLPMFIAKSVHA
jgi:hypothetical protein